MPHLTLVPDLPAQECRCDRDSGRYWFHGEWRCKATDSIVRSASYAGIGWHHYPGHRNMAGLIQYTEEQAA